MKDEHIILQKDELEELIELGKRGEVLKFNGIILSKE